MISFEVLGLPVAQGSKVAGVAKNGRAFMRESGASRLTPWRHEVSAQALAAMRQAGRQDPFSGPVRLRLDFAFPRPRKHYRTGKRAAELRDDAPALLTGKPDLSKLVRAVEDALTAIVYRDDSQVAVLSATKSYGVPGVRVEAQFIGAILNTVNANGKP